MNHLKIVTSLVIFAILTLPFEGYSEESSIRFGSESVSPDGLWLALYQFYKEEGSWYGRIAVYSNEDNHRSRAILSVEYLFPENHFKSRSAVFDWSGASLVVKTEAGIGAKHTRVTRINIKEGTLSMELRKGESLEL